MTTHEKVRTARLLADLLAEKLARADNQNEADAVRVALAAECEPILLTMLDLVRGVSK